MANGDGAYKTCSAAVEQASVRESMTMVGRETTGLQAITHGPITHALSTECSVVTLFRTRCCEGPSAVSTSHSRLWLCRCRGPANNFETH